MVNFVYELSAVFNSNNKRPTFNYKLGNFANMQLSRENITIVPPKAALNSNMFPTRIFGVLMKT